jgi:hypothetical protein
MQDLLVARQGIMHASLQQNRMKKEWKGKSHGAIQVMLMPTLCW